VGSVGLDTAFTDENTSGFSGAKPASLDKLTDRMAKGEFDLVAVGRALIANPDWAQKMEADAHSEVAAYTKDMLAELV